MYKKLIELQNKIFDDYNRSTHRIVADYKNEKAITKDYDSRQLLEMLQNADDAKSNKVEIQIDTESSLIKICNVGNPFSYEGFESIMIPNYSSKTDGSPIGNKGLGFRSVLSWAEWLCVQTNDCKLTFSESKAGEALIKVLDGDSSRIDELNERGGFAKGTKPFPTMAAPYIEQNSVISTWTTVIEIKYFATKQASILKQVELIREEILLFLNHITELDVIIDGKTVKSFRAEIIPFGNYKQIQVGDKEWKVFEKKGFVPDKLQDATKAYKQSYQVKVAFQKDLSDDYPYLFNFFPTKVKIHLPCILHGTFELNNSRDYLNDSELNKFVISEFIDVFKSAIGYLKNLSTNWLPYQLVNPSSIATDSSIIPLLYDELEVLREKLDIYPCFDGAYRVNGEWFNHSHFFNSFMFKHFKSYFPKFLLPNSDFTSVNRMSIESLQEIINTISSQSLTDELRADIIEVLVSESISNSDDDLKFDILINDSGEGISSDILTFTPILNNNLKFNLPREVVEIDFLSQKLYTILNQKFRSKYKKNEPEARELQRIIKDVCNLQPYDSSNLIDKVISSFRQYIKYLDDSASKMEAIKLLVKTLYSIYSKIDRKTDVLSQTIPLLNELNEVVNAQDLYLGNSYKNASIITYCYDGYLQPKDYLQKSDFWELDTVDLEDFFVWLGVNQFLKTDIISLNGKWKYQNYFNLIGGEQNLSSDFNINRIAPKTTITKLVNLNELALSIGREKLLILVYYDYKVRGLVLENNENIYWSFSNSQRIIKTEISFINYQIISTNLFDDIILQSFSADIMRFLNDNLIDYHILNQYGINNIVVNNLLSKLGAKVNFSDLSIDRIYSIIKGIPDIDTERNGKGTSTLYVKLIEALSEKKVTVEEIEKYFPLNLFGKKGNSQDYLSNLDLKYVANAVFSNQILSKIPLINLPKRYNEVNIQKYLGVSSLKESDIEILSDSIKESRLNQTFILEFEKYKPSILTYRLFSPNLRKPINEESQRYDESKLLKRLNIVCVASLDYKFQEKVYKLAPYDFISKNNKFYINIPSHISSVQEVFKDSSLCDAFAEILCVQFKISELKSDFRFVIKNELRDTEHVIRQEYSEHLDVVKELMGVPFSMSNFWDNIFNLLQIKPDDDVFTSETSLDYFVRNELGIPIDFTQINFNHFDNEYSFSLIKYLVQDKNIALKDIRDNGLKEWHNYQLENYYYERENIIDYMIWNHYSQDHLQQKYIESLRDIKYKLQSNLNSYFVNNEKERFKLEVDYDQIIVEALNNEYCRIYQDYVQGNSSNLTTPKILYYYLLEELELNINNLELNLQSLFYFENNESVIRELLRDETINLEKTKDVINEINYSNSILINDITLLAPENISKNDLKSTKRNYVHNSSDDEHKRNLGKIAEKIAYSALVKEYGEENVKWKSSNSDTPDKSDGLHYDIMYKNKCNEWKKLEVKHFNGRYFKISKDELNLGLDNPLDFEIGLVEKENLYIVKNLFQFNEGEELFRNSSFTLEANNYTIYYTKKT